MGDREALLIRLYEAFNRKDIDAVMAALHPDVSWPNLFGEGRLHGHDAMRAMWRDQFSRIDPEGTPISFATLPDGRVEVMLAYVVRTLEGKLFTEGIGTESYCFGGELIIGMEWS